MQISSELSTVSASELFTPLNIATFGIAVAAVNSAANALRAMFGLDPRKTAFIASLVIAYLIVGMKPAPPWYEWILAFFNACLLFCSATGANETAAVLTPAPPGKGFLKEAPFYGSWFRAK